MNNISDMEEKESINLKELDDKKTNKKNIWKNIVIILLVVSLIISTYMFVSPVILTRISKAEEVTNTELDMLFSTDYEYIRERFLKYATEIDRKNVSIESYPINEQDGLYIDSIMIDADEKKENLIVITTGVHGIEGYVGAAMIDEFMKNTLPTLNANTTGVKIISNVNPYGVKYGRRYNENNVDLNRNFIYNWEEYNLDSNTEYPKVHELFEKDTPIGNIGMHELQFLGDLAINAVTEGVDTITNALLTGQYRYPSGVYYGGNGDEKSTEYLKTEFDEIILSGYENIIYIDIHTGYGDRENMTIFNTVDDMRTEAETIEDFGYETVLAYDSEEYYATEGDTTEYFMKRSGEIAPEVNTFATCFEFGTLGDDLFASILSLKYTVDENRNYFYPTEVEETEIILSQRYLEMFAPTEETWREKAIQDFNTATEGVLANKLY